MVHNYLKLNLYDPGRILWIASQFPDPVGECRTKFYQSNQEYGFLG